MADELDKNILVHQAIHGYADGHRLLASSINLKPRDLQKTMLVMSDSVRGRAQISATAISPALSSARLPFLCDRPDLAGDGDDPPWLRLDAHPSRRFC